ncbi:drug/metabolite transporter (DMT)-like permease [Endobacter medicaginis]|uniref:Drug/metabolite transporter (DMT)-like permease n=2 Tax=Endobacter medicaginis TaxID=1181271 RepID=A0A839V2N2_9PROT|nr:DMT family transporter [Endobacter medicaginis]MBB3173789.1 drug/metabolite transporter (DMT)-like permease [Endobacter medicaginis]MCX5475574.1 DMT family transporter [Endobacter medicaginis]
MARSVSTVSREWPLVVITCVWGTTFLVTRIGLAETGPLFFVALRFAVAAIALAAFCGRSLLDLRRIELVAGVSIGLVIALGSVLQTMAIERLPSSMVAFLTAFYVPLVPLLQWLLLRRPPGWRGWIGALAGFAGLALIAGPVSGGSLLGELQAIGCALAFGFEIILIGRVAARVDARRFAVVQVVTVSLASLAAMPLLGEHPVWPDARLALCVLYLGLASAIVQAVVSWAQRVVSPTRATIIYATEPVWAGLIGAAAGEPIGWRAACGAVLIGLGVLSSSLPLPRFSATRRWLAAPRRGRGRGRRSGAAACRT